MSDPDAPMDTPLDPPVDQPAAAVAAVDEPVVWLVGIRLREPLTAEDYATTDPGLAVGDFVLVETGGGTTIGEVRRPKRVRPEFKRDRLFRKVLRRATSGETEDWRARRRRELEGVQAVKGMAAARGLAIKIVDVALEPGGRRVTVSFNSDDRIDFRDLVRDLAHHFHARIEMKQIGARDTSKLLDGIGPCGRQLCCSSYLRKFEPISVKMAKAQDMPLTDNRLLGNCGRLKCCLLYEFSTYEELRSRLPRVGSACQAECGGSGCMTGKVRALRVLKQAVVVRFEDGTEAEVPLDQVTWEGRPHIKPL